MTDKPVMASSRATSAALPSVSTAGGLARLMRPADWVKNVVVLIAIVTSKNLHDLAAQRDALLAFLSFCLLSSGFYAINDALDVDADRRHPLKRHRPVAAGIITPSRAIGFGLALIVVALGMGFFTSRLLGLILVIYGALQTLYNLRLKRARMLDVTALALGFVLRAIAGAVAIEVQTSIWLALCVFFLCLYLGFIKRLADLVSAMLPSGGGEDMPSGSRRWHSPAGYDSRDELNWLLGVSAALTLTTYLMDALSPHAARLFGARALGFALLTPLVVIVIYRFFLRASAGLSDRPVDALREDRVILATTLLFAIGVVLSLYGRGIDGLFERLLIH